MRYVIYGAGGVGGTIGARLAESGRDVTLIARGPHLRALQEEGLQFAAPDGVRCIQIPAVEHPDALGWRGDEVVFLTMKSQHTAGALQALKVVAPQVPVVCAQNGVANERLAAEHFDQVVAMVVWLPALHVEPGQVVSYGKGRSGVLDCGLYGGGTDQTVDGIAEALNAACFSAQPDADAMRWKYAKLLTNLGNALEAMCHRGGLREFSRQLRQEALDCFEAAGHSVPDRDAVRARLAGVYEMVDVPGFPRGGGSTWQSVVRGTGDVETTYLNGEIVELGRAHGVPTPANAAVVNAMQVFVQTSQPAGGWTLAQLRAAAEQMVHE